MAKKEQEIADLDSYFNRSDIQEEIKKFVANWQPPNYQDEFDQQDKSPDLIEYEITNEK